jgi:hypothetical protein
MSTMGMNLEEPVLDKGVQGRAAGCADQFNADAGQLNAAQMLASLLLVILPGCCPSRVWRRWEGFTPNSPTRSK